MTLQAKKFDSETERMEWNLANHTPAPHQMIAIEIVRSAFMLAALDVLEHCPAGRERSLALTAIEEATMWATAAIARAEVVE